MLVTEAVTEFLRNKTNVENVKQQSFAKFIIFPTFYRYELFHEQLCKYKYKPYFDFLIEFFTSKLLINYVCFDEFALEMFIGNDDNPYCDKSICLAEINSSLCFHPFSYFFNFIFDSKQTITVNGQILFKYCLFKNNIKQFPEMAHICLCSLPPYVEYCKKFSEKQIMRIVMIHDGLQAGTEMNLIADEFIVFNIIKFL